MLAACGRKEAIQDKLRLHGRFAPFPTLMEVAANNRTTREIGKTAGCGATSPPP